MRTTGNTFKESDSWHGHSSTDVTAHTDTGSCMLIMASFDMGERISPERAFGQSPSCNLKRTADVCLIINVFGVDVTHGIDEQG